MATNLKTDYKDYIPPESGKRYIITTDSQGYSTIQDATEYTQEGDTFGANDINTTNNTINNLTAADVGITEMHQTITASTQFKSVNVKVARIGNIVTITAPIVSNYQKGEGGYPTMITLPVNYRPSIQVDILSPAGSAGDLANIIINPSTGALTVGILGNSSTINLRVNLSYVI